jgi:hypothetical protein
VFDSLRRRNESGILGPGLEIRTHHLAAFLKEAGHCRATFSTGLFAHWVQFRLYVDRNPTVDTGFFPDPNLVGCRLRDNCKTDSVENRHAKSFVKKARDLYASNLKHFQQTQKSRLSFLPLWESNQLRDKIVDGVLWSSEVLAARI